ncbi:translation initiation factor eIF-2B subunit epsilon isoform X2 [Thrips palmi]|uniref:Translation initiation factor eIF2B subunit epsilon n=1 Tax=Thrips palmi TaxID=161013 RepID=A0A6P9AI37_THRPL|nr:translation initiation factor eIF-2B subunit epsilon isoform X2 [Thrips palmi]
MSRNKSNKDLDSLKKEDVVQAVVVADNFSDAFVPLTNETPSCLLPLVNTCLLDHTLEWLSNSGVQEAFLFCSRHVEKVKEHIRKSKWGDSTSPLLLNTIVSETCLTLGDAMRDLDAKGLIRGDFILVMGDTVANVNLLPILEKHRKLQKVDKGLAMTVVYKYAGPSHVGRAPQDDVLVAVDKKTSKILFHQKRIASNDNKKVHIPMEVILDRPSIDIYNDVIDTHVSICSVSVLPLFSDNFDFQTREDFIKGLLMNEEILASSLAAYCLSDREYAASVNSWHMYKNVTQNMIHRWTFPLVPDMFTNEKEIYQYLRGNVYKQHPVTLARSSIIEDDTVIGGGSEVGESSTIRRSVVGRNCHIGNGVKIEDSYVWDGCIIKDNCTIQRSVVGSNCVVGEGSVLSQGCILGQGVQCPPGYTGNTRLQSCQGDDDDLDMVGDAAYIVKLDNDDSDSEDDENQQIWSDLYCSNQIEEVDGDSDESSEMSDESDRSISPVLDDTKLFYNEVVDSLKRGYEDKLHCDNLILEINSSRYAYNVSMREVNLLVVKAILNLPKLESGSYLPQLWPLQTYFMPIYKNYIRNPTAQIDCLQALQELAMAEQELLTAVPKLLSVLYNQDILNEEVILKWHSELEGDSEAEDLYKVAGPFIKWLEEAEVESEDESD